MGSGRSSPGAKGQTKVYGHGHPATWPLRTGTLRRVREHILRSVLPGERPWVLLLCLRAGRTWLYISSSHAPWPGTGCWCRPRVQDLCQRQPRLSGGWAGAHRCPLCSSSCSTILIPREGWHMLLNLCFHIAMTAAVFAGGITLTGYRAVCQAVGTGQRPAPRGAAGRAPGRCSIPSPTAASSRRSASSCTTPRSPRCSGWR